jgi:hypothetical protein
MPFPTFSQKSWHQKRRLVQVFLLYREEGLASGSGITLNFSLSKKSCIKEIKLKSIFLKRFCENRFFLYLFRQKGDTKNADCEGRF